MAKVKSDFQKEQTMNPFVKHSIRLAAMAVLAIGTAIPALPQNGPQRGPFNPRTPIAVQPATAEEIRSLTFMREEEKLARDVYRFLYERWSYVEFDRIAAAEQQHFTMIGNLLTRYSIPDPAAADTPGVFADPNLTALYAELTTKGAVSMKDALEVGVLIEKQDIADLEAAVGTTAKYDIKRVYTNLMAASHNHLAAFEAALELAANF